MGIKRTVTTEVRCDICGEVIAAWRDTSTRGGVSRAWAAAHARERGATVGKRVICKACRIKRRIEACRESAREGDGTCLGWQKSEHDDEPIEKCERCIANRNYDWERKNE